MKDFSISKKNSKSQINSFSNPLFPLRDSLSFNYNEHNNKEVLDNIIHLIKLETDNNITNFDVIINNFLRKNEKIKNDVIEKILDFISKNNLHYKSIIKCTVWGGKDL